MENIKEFTLTVHNLDLRDPLTYIERTYYYLRKAYGDHVTYKRGDFPSRYDLHYQHLLEFMNWYYQEDKKVSLRIDKLRRDYEKNMASQLTGISASALLNPNQLRNPASSGSKSIISGLFDYFNDDYS